MRFLVCLATAAVLATVLLAEPAHAAPSGRVFRASASHPSGLHRVRNGDRLYEVDADNPLRVSHPGRGFILPAAIAHENQVNRRIMARARRAALQQTAEKPAPGVLLLNAEVQAPLYNTPSYVNSR